MKRLLSILALCAFTFCAYAADMTISFTGAQAQRFQAAVGSNLNLRDANGAPRSATAQEARQYVIDRIKQTTLNHERNVETQKITVQAFDLDPPPQ